MEGVKVPLVHALLDSSQKLSILLKKGIVGQHLHYRLAILLIELAHTPPHCNDKQIA